MGSQALAASNSEVLLSGIILFMMSSLMLFLIFFLISSNFSSSSTLSGLNWSGAFLFSVSATTSSALALYSSLAYSSQSEEMEMQRQSLYWLKISFFSMISSSSMKSSLMLQKLKSASPFFAFLLTALGRQTQPCFTIFLQSSVAMLSNLVCYFFSVLWDVVLRVYKQSRWVMSRAMKSLRQLISLAA